MEKILYPLDKQFAQYELANKQMKGAGGLFSIVLKSNCIQEVERVYRGL